MMLMAPACKRCQISWAATYTIVATAAIAAMTSKIRCSKRHVSIWELADDWLGLSKAGPFRVFCGVPADRHGFVVAGYARGSDLRPKGLELPVMLRGEPHVLAWWHAPCLWEARLLVALNPRRESCGRSSGDTYPSAISCSSWPIGLFPPVCHLGYEPYQTDRTANVAHTDCHANSGDSAELHSTEGRRNDLGSRRPFGRFVTEPPTGRLSCRPRRD